MNNHNQQYINTQPQKKRELHLPSFLNCNARSICPKIDYAECLIIKNKIDIACITETWCNPNIDDRLLQISNYAIERKDRIDQIGGGILCYIKKDIHYRRWNNLENEFETMWLTIRTQRMPRNHPYIIIGIIYCPPKTNDWLLTQHIISSIDKITTIHPNSAIFLIGDFNQLKDRHLITNLNVKQIVKKATRGSNILDKIYTTMAEVYNTQVTDGLQNSDHNCILAYPTNIKEYQKQMKEKNTIYRRNQTHVRKCLLASELKQKKWDILYKLP